MHLRFNIDIFQTNSSFGHFASLAIPTQRTPIVFLNFILSESGKLTIGNVMREMQKVLNFTGSCTWFRQEYFQFVAVLVRRDSNTRKKIGVFRNYITKQKSWSIRRSQEQCRDLSLKIEKMPELISYFAPSVYKNSNSWKNHKAFFIQICLSVRGYQLTLWFKKRSK